ncbi:nucleotidyltransferase domain-containing protein [Herbiconiux liukaitaii]|uniref:nucleotidyltransferase domain-containing protein n=1 Tax=Herbiconiux liukaitaii TaxID=3342799 RepID=UPI0035B972F8
MQLNHPLRVITAAVDGEILTVLARAEAEFTVPDLQSMIGRSTEGVRRALGRLTDQGIVVRRSVGRTASYRLNREHLAAPWIIGLADLPALLRSRIGDEMATWARPPTYAALFGSAARKDMRVDSDIDIMLVGGDIEAPEWEERVAQLARSITAWTGNDARPLVFAESEIRGRLADEPILQEILDEGIPLAGNRQAFRRLVGA